MPQLSQDELHARRITPESIHTLDPYEGGLLLLDKPRGWSSFQAVKKVRFLMRQPKRKLKVGHAGTLDPLATGLLLICVGPFTKQLQYLTGLQKAYVADIKLGVTTASYDGEHPEENHKPTDHITKSDIEAALGQFRGEIEQVPPVFSAVSVNGQRAYKAARKGRTPELKARKVMIHSLELVEYESPQAFKLQIECSKGTYIRTLAHDLGQALGVGGYLTGLVRTQIGDYKLEDAWQLANLVSVLEPEQAP